MLYTQTANTTITTNGFGETTATARTERYRRPFPIPDKTLFVCTNRSNNQIAFLSRSKENNPTKERNK